MDKMIPNRLFGFLFTGIVLVIAVTGCQRKATDGNDAPKKGTIGVSLLTMTNPFFKEIANHMTLEAEKQGFEIVVVSGERDAATQRNQVRDFITQGVDAIILTPCDSKGVGAAIREANEAGIPVFTADVACLDKDAKVVCHVATDNYGGGKEAARQMIEALGGEGKVAIIDYPEVESVILRTKGFREIIEEENRKADINIEIVSALPGHGDRDESFKVMQDLLTSHPDLDGVFAINDPSAFGAMAAIPEDKRDQLIIIGFDGVQKAKEAVRDGLIYADIVQYTDKIAIGSIQAVIAHIKGEEVKPEILIPAEAYKKADADKDTTLD